MSCLVSSPLQAKHENEVKTKMVQTRFVCVLHKEPVQGSWRQGSDTRWWGLTQGVWRPVQYSDEVDVDVKVQVEFKAWVEDDNVWIEEYFDLVGGEAAAREVQGVFWKKLRSFCCVKDGHYPNVRSRLLEVDQELWKGRCLPRRDAGDLQLRSRSCEIKSTHLETGEGWSSHTFIPLAGDQPLEQVVVWKKATVGEV